ncbi:efflux RND transporter permease subunit [Pseudohalioglobus sediminis]|uniref:Efflux RND transporter permease subunit n=1 Tax=Pseudohalioglobus sediminis TaxID=2606449 RepID=A0A5B0X0B7_9GAMM|nr:efflux RND transporter permease subunit [Pseudohalioglobus sediminis]KAA1192762.1 efflux RND transporter permease subunit [Pseudohalioglobus sediminis]
MHKVINWWVHNPVAANLLMIGIVLSGFLGMQAMEREAFPNIKINQASIQVAWPGANPQEVEEQVIVRIEQSLENVDQVYHYESTANEGFAEINVTTYPNVDINEFINEVKAAVDAVTSLPRDIEAPRVQRRQSRGEMLRVVLHGDVSERELTRLAEDLKDEMASLPYLSTINLFGTRKEEVTIELSESAMRRFGLSFQEVANAIRANSINLSSGRVRTETGDVQLRARNLADDQADFERIVIRQTPEGAVVRVGDVARVIDGFEENEILATLNGQPAVLLQALETENMQVVKASNAVKAWMEEVRPRLPQGIQMTMWFDTADIYKERMGLIAESSYIGLALVFLVLILSLRPKVALWVTAGIAVAFIGTFALLPVNDVSMNTISSFAFLMVLGIVVDDAIVVGESVHHHAHLSGGGPRSAVDGATAVSRPVIFAVLTTMIAFAPWLFVSGETAQITRQLSIVITVALTISLIEAFFILPTHLRHLEPRKNLRGLARTQQKIEHSIIDFARNTYRPVLSWAIAHRYLTASAFIGAFVISIGIFTSGWVKFYFMPEVQSEQIYINVLLPNGTPYSRALEILDQLQEAELKLIDEVEQRAQTGAGSGKLIEGWYTRSRRDSVIAIVKLAPPEVRDLSAKEAAERLRELVGDIPDADEIEVNYTINDSGADVTYLLKHQDAQLLSDASRDLRAQLSSYNGTFFVRDSQRGESDEIILNLRPGAEKLGITLADVSQQVRQAYFGEEVQRLPRENGDVKVMVKYPVEQRNNLSSLDNFRVRTADGREVPLLSVVEVELASGVQRIKRRDGQRFIRVRADMDHDLMGDITRDINDNFLPQLRLRYPGLEVLKGGQQEEEQEFFSEILALYAVALFAMYTLIAIAFHSYWLPLLVMTAIPFGFMGAIFGHLLFGTPMAMFSWFGIGAAAGVVVNDNLVLVDYIGRLREEGHKLHAAIIEAGVSRFRPILLTTVTTFVGLIPIMSERATDAQFLKPAVLSLAFGVLFALFVTLLMVPALYAIGGDLGRHKSRLASRLFPRNAHRPAHATTRDSE